MRNRKGASTAAMASVAIVALLVGAAASFFVVSSSKSAVTNTETVYTPSGTVTTTYTSPSLEMVTSTVTQSVTQTATQTVTSNVVSTTTALSTTTATSISTTTSTSTATTTTTSAVTELGPGTVALGASTNPQSVAIDTQNNEAYVALMATGQVAIVSLVTNTLVSTISCGAAPSAVLYDPNNNDVYVADAGTSTSNSQEINVINTSTNTCGTQIPLGGSNDQTNALAFNSGSNLIYAASNNDDAVIVVNAQTNQLAATLQNHTYALDNAQSITFDPKTNLLYVGEYYGNAAKHPMTGVGVVNTANLSVNNGIVTAIGIDGNQANGVAVDPTTNTLYVANTIKNLVNVINLSTNKAIVNLTVTAPTGIAYDAAKNLVFATNSNTNTVTMISTNTNAVVGTITVGNGPSFIGVSADGNWIYVTDATDGTLFIVNVSADSG